MSDARASLREIATAAAARSAAAPRCPPFALLPSLPSSSVRSADPAVRAAEVRACIADLTKKTKCFELVAPRLDPDMRASLLRSYASAERHLSRLLAGETSWDRRAAGPPLPPGLEKLRQRLEIAMSR